MDPVSKLIATYKIPVGPWGKAFIDFIVTYFQWFFDALSAVLEWGVEGTTFVLLQSPPVILAIALAGLAYWMNKLTKPCRRGFHRAALHHQSRLLEGDDRDAGAGHCRRGVSMLIGVPLGIGRAHAVASGASCGRCSI